ncbi:MAG: glutaredoxin family protein [Pseudohongiellaceae bacterium]
MNFYTTAGCHLCEEAERLLIELVAQHPVTVEVIDIAADEGLAEEYGIRIPVVRHQESGREAGWPFSYGDLVRLLGED